MKSTAIILAALCVALVSSHPLPEGERLRSEALDRLMVVEADNDVALRSKRTIGILRELFPEISQDVNPEAEDRVNEVAAESQNNEVKVQFADEAPSDVAPLTPLDEVEAEDDENRNKRFLNFGFGGSSGGSGSGAGSGNFLFDIIRMVAGSGSQASGGAAIAGKAEDAPEAVPGPVTRLFVIANRGISNLIQDLILRLAATSERIVNFKARLITSII
ncbi:uncharacterized protein LOC143207319 isoform X3 [Lasioglossum baleicum]|uniref:uncharacterized protein LOC143207319 isoform X3 n=1 Tax=Lasioglossum baleicum TaxID=434251 RepID=UPI003FCDFFAC